MKTTCYTEKQNFHCVTTFFSENYTVSFSFLLPSIPVSLNMIFFFSVLKKLNTELHSLSIHSSTLVWLQPDKEKNALKALFSRKNCFLYKGTFFTVLMSQIKSKFLLIWKSVFPKCEYDLQSAVHEY